MPENPKIYRNDQAPTNPQQGDLLFNPSNNTFLVYTGSSWVQARFTGLTLTDAASQIVPGATSFAVRNNANSQNNLVITDAGNGTFAGTVTATGITPTAGFTNSTSATPAWYVPGASGNPTGAVASLAGRAALYYDTAGARLWARFAGSWWATPSFILGG